MRTPTHPSRIPRETQPLGLQALQSRFVTVYGQDISEETKEFIDKLLAGSSLLPATVAAEGLTAASAVGKIAEKLAPDGHLLLCVHGINHRQTTPQGASITHYASVQHRGRPQIPTAKLIRKILNQLDARPRRPGAAAGDLPFVYLFSCESGALRKQIRPGSELWKRAYVLAFAGSGSTSMHSAGNAIRGAIAYVDRCQRNMEKVDPMKLILFAGLRSGETVTLIGGMLEEPIVWHAPKSVQDQEIIASLARLSCSPRDRERVAQAATSLQGWEYALLPAASQTEVLFNRIARDDAVRVKALAEAHPELLSRRTATNDLPLCFAAEDQASGCLRSLLEAGADPNGSGDDGLTPLMLALLRPIPRIDDIALLLAHGADPNQQDVDGFTALMFAVQGMHVEAVRLLLSQGADISLRTTGGISCLEAAAYGNQIETLDLLLDAGAGPSAGLCQQLLDDTMAAGHSVAAAMLRDALDHVNASQHPSG